MRTDNVTALRQGEPEHRDVRAEVQEIQARTSLSQTAVAREAGVGQAALNQYLKGTYTGDNDGVEAKLLRWIDAHRTREAEARMLPPAPAWVQTPTAERVLAAMQYAQIAGDIAVIYGAAGMGKTTAARHHAETSPSVWIATMTPATAGVVTALEEVAEAVGLREASGGAARVQRAIIKRIRDTYGLLIIDEAQHLSVAALDAVRALHDATGIGIVLLGNEQVYARMTGGNRAPFLDRLYSRIGKRVRLTRARKDDADALLNAWGLQDGGIQSTVREIAGKPGALRGVTKTLRLASMFAASHGGQITESDVRAAWRDLGGES